MAGSFPFSLSPTDHEASILQDLSHHFEEVRLVYRNKTKAENRPQIKTPEAASEILRQIWSKDQIELLEECKLLLLDRQLRLMSVANLSFGGMTEVLIDPRVIFSIALKRRADSFILAHNHPSGSLTPSRPDIRMTDKIKALGEMISIRLEDHIILTTDGFYSISTDRQGVLEW